MGKRRQRDSHYRPRDIERDPYDRLRARWKIGEGQPLTIRFCVLWTAFMLVIGAISHLAGEPLWVGVGFMVAIIWVGYFWQLWRLRL